MLIELLSEFHNIYIIHFFFCAFKQNKIIKFSFHAKIKNIQRYRKTKNLTFAGSIFK